MQLCLLQDESKSIRAVTNLCLSWQGFKRTVNSQDEILHLTRNSKSSQCPGNDFVHVTHKMQISGFSTRYI